MAQREAMDPYSEQDHRAQARVLELDLCWAAAALLGTSISAFIALAFTLLRLGLVTPTALVPGGVAIVAAAAFAPLLLSRRGRLADVRGRALAYPLVSFAVLASVLLALPLGPALLPLYPVLAVAGLAKALVLARGTGRWGLVGPPAAALPVAVYLFVVVNNLGGPGVYMPEQGLLGLLDHDSHLHTAVAFLVQNFGVPSLGVDGILQMRYHIGSHVWFAAFGRLTGTEPLFSYAAGVLVIAVPALVISLIFSGLALDRARKSVWAYVAIGLFLLFLSDAIGSKSYYISESYTFGLIGLLLFMPLLARLARPDDRSGDAVLFGLGVVAVFFLMSLKVSVGILWAVALGWIALRRFGMRTATFVIGAACGVALFSGLRLFAPGPGDYVNLYGSPIVPFLILRISLDVRNAFSSFMFPICLALLVVATARTTRGMSAKELVLSKSELMVEAIIVVTAVGALPAYLGVPQNDASWYFLNVGQWCAMAVLLSRLSPEDFREMKGHLSAGRLAGQVSVVLVFLLLGHLIQSFTPSFYRGYNQLLYAADRKNGGNFLHSRNATQYLHETLSTERSLFGREFREALSGSVGGRLVSEVEAAGPVRPDLAVFIPPGNVEFWKFREDCWNKHNVQVSLTGRPSLLGAPPKEYHCDPDAYLADYGEHIDSRVLSDADLCIHARERHIRWVLILNDLHRSNANRVLRCT